MITTQDRKYKISRICLAYVLFLSLSYLLASCNDHTKTYHSDLIIRILNKTDANKLKFEYRGPSSAEMKTDEDPNGIHEVDLTQNDSEIRDILVTTFVAKKLKCGAFILPNGECFSTALDQPTSVGGFYFSIIGKFPYQICSYVRDSAVSSTIGQSNLNLFYHLLTIEATCPPPSSSPDYTIFSSAIWVQNHELDDTHTLTISVKAGGSISFQSLTEMDPKDQVTLKGPEGWVPEYFDFNEEHSLFSIHPAAKVLQILFGILQPKLLSDPLQYRHYLILPVYSSSPPLPCSIIPLTPVLPVLTIRTN